MSRLTDATVLVTGGAGSVGSTLISMLVKTDVRSVRVFDNDEGGLYRLKHDLPSKKVRLLVGDVKDRDRVRLALKQVDIVIHAAALANLELTEYNTVETVRTNIDGTINIIETALETEVKRFLYVSSDKAVNPTTLFGATKFVGERLVQWADSVSQTCRFSSCRFGSVVESNASVYRTWERQLRRGEPLSISEPEAVKYFWHADEAAAFIISSLRSMKGGETFVPKMQRSKVKDLAFRITGLAPGEKMSDDLMTDDEMKRAEERRLSWVVS